MDASIAKHNIKTIEEPSSMQKEGEEQDTLFPLSS